MAESIHQVGNISLGSRGGVSQGQLKIHPGGLVWKRSGGGKTVEVKKDDIFALVWTKVPRGCQLSIRRKEGTHVNLLGFQPKDYEQLREFSQKNFGKDIQEMAMATNGRNFGSLVLNGSALAFMVGDKVSFELPLPDVAAVQANKDEVMLEFALDDTGGSEREDVLVEMAFIVPAGNTDFPTNGDGENPAKAFERAVKPLTDGGAASADESVCGFDDVLVQVPRGRFDIDIQLGSLKLTSQTQEFRIRYSSILRLFLLPRPSAAAQHAMVAITLDPPIRKGQTFYGHVLCQFPADEEITVQLDMPQDAMEQRNEKNGGKLKPEMSGRTFELFASIISDLSGAKLSKQGTFRNGKGDAAIRCSFKNDQGLLYPLERAFFYVGRPPMLVLHDEIEYVEFQRQLSSLHASSAKTFDLKVKKRDQPEMQFINIVREEWQSLFDFINHKKIRIENLQSAQKGPGGVGGAMEVDDIDPGLRTADIGGDDDSEEDDEDFNAAAGSGSGSESGSAAGSDDDASGSADSSDAEMVDEEDVKLQDFDKEAKKRKVNTPPAKAEPKVKGKENAPAAAKKPKAKAEKPAKEEKAEGGKKPRKKKDPNEPKRGLSAFMFFSNENRDRIKTENPALKFGEIGRALGEEWKSLTADDKVKYDEMAAKDKERWVQQMAVYKGTAAGPSAADAEEDVEMEDPGDDEE